MLYDEWCFIENRRDQMELWESDQFEKLELLKFNYFGVLFGTKMADRGMTYMMKAALLLTEGGSCSLPSKRKKG